MGTIILPCCGCPTWVEKALAKVAQFDDDSTPAQDPEEFRQEVEQAVASIPFRDEGRIINPEEWGKKRKRPRALAQSIKNKAQKGVRMATEGYHNGIPVQSIIAALGAQGLVPVNENGERWQGMLAGAALCGSEEAKNQNAHIQLAAMGPDGKWELTTFWLYLSYCLLDSGRYEIICYLS